MSAQLDLLVVQNAKLEPLGHLEAGLRDVGLTWRTVHAWDGERVPSTLGDHLGLVLLGGPASAYLPEQWPFLEREMMLVREARALRVPVLGICLGAQIIAHALGGRAFRGDAPEVGHVPLTFAAEADGDRIFSSFPRDLPVFQLHHDTFEPPPGAVVLASSARYAQQAFRVDDRIYGLQFHPEFTADMVERVLPHEEADLKVAGADARRIVDTARTLDARYASACRTLASAFSACGCFD